MSAVTAELLSPADVSKQPHTGDVEGPSGRGDGGAKARVPQGVPFVAGQRSRKELGS